MKQHTASELIFKSDLSTRARIVFMYLSYRSNKENTCFPSIKTIARECGMAVSTVKRALGDLDFSGYIRKDPRFRDDNGQTSNLYTLVEECPVVSDTAVAVAPIKDMRHAESNDSEATIAEEMNDAVECGECSVGNFGAKIKTLIQSTLTSFMAPANDRGAVHSGFETMKVSYHKISTTPAIIKLRSTLERGEPPPGSFP